MSPDLAIMFAVPANMGIVCWYRVGVGAVSDVLPVSVSVEMKMQFVKKSKVSSVVNKI